MLSVSLFSAVFITISFTPHLPSVDILRFSIPCMLTIIVWTNIIVIEIGFILGAALLLSKAGNEENSEDPSRLSSTEVLSLFENLSDAFLISD